MTELKPEHLVIGEVTELEEFGAILRLEDFNKQAFLHISEVPLKRGERIDNKIKPRSKLVVRVLREDKKSNRVFVSLKQIPKQESKIQMRLWKETRNATAIIQKATEGKIDDQTFMSKIERKAIEKYGSLGNALKVSIEEGPRTLIRLGIPAEFCEQVILLARNVLVKKLTKRTKRMKIMFTSPDGLDLLKRTVSGIDMTKGGVFIAVRSQAPPLYYVTAYGPNPKPTSLRLEEAVDSITKYVGSLGGYTEIIE